MAKRKVKGKRGLPYNMFKGEGESMNMLQKSGAVANNAFGSSNLGGTIGSIGSGITSIAQAGMNNAQIADTSSIQDQIKAQNNMVVGASDNDSLLSEWSSLSMLKDNYSWKDVRGGSNANRAMNTIGGAVQGAATGATVGGPLGAIVGGVIGLGSAIGGWITGNRKAKRAARRLNQQASAANQRALTSFENRASDIDTQNDLTMASNYFDYGGPIFSTGAIGYDLASRDLNNKQMKALGDMRLTSLPNSFNALPDVSTINTFSEGGGIHIKEKNKGKFTDYCGGKVTSECIQRGLHSSNPTTRKRANFARNARKWHGNGGWLDEINNNPFFTLIKFVDPTGISSYYDVYDAGKDLYNNPSWSNAGALGIEVLGALPLVGKLGKATKLGSKITKGDKTFEAGAKTLDYLTSRFPAALKDGYDMQKYEESKKNKKAKGGPLLTHGTEWDTGMTYINNGGTHEENPFEGVQMGIDPQGVPNLVEEGEVIFNDYVFSNRMKVPKAIRQKYKLRDNITFAEAAKKLGKESEERPNDPISKRGLESFMSALAESQEEVRIKNEDRRMNRYAKGGKLGNLFDGTGNKSNRLNPYSNFVPLTDDSFYTPEYMDFWNWYNTNQNTPEGQAWLKRINSGEFGPIGGNTFAPQDIIRLSHDYKQGPVHNAFAAAAKQYNIENPKEDPYTPYTKRWIREKGADGEWRTQQITDEEWNSAPAGRTYLMRNTNLKEGNTVTSDRGDKDIYYDVIPEELPEELTGDVTEVKGIRQNPLGYAPLIGSDIAVLNDIFGGNDPDYSNADMFASAIRNANRPVGTRPIGEYLAYKPLDRMFYINQLNRNAAAGRRAIQNTSGGNRAAALAGILAEDYNYGENLGQLARQAEEYNQALKEKVTGFNRQTNMFNSEQGTKVDMFNSELLGKQASLYGQLANMRQRILEGNRAEKSANLTNFIQGLGDLGRELTDRDTLRWLADIGALPYNTRGQYTGGNNTAAPKKSKSSKSKKNKKKGYTV